MQPRLERRPAEQTVEKVHWMALLMFLEMPADQKMHLPLDSWRVEQVGLLNHSRKLSRLLLPFHSQQVVQVDPKASQQTPLLWQGMAHC